MPTKMSSLKKAFRWINVKFQDKKHAEYKHRLRKDHITIPCVMIICLLPYLYMTLNWSKKIIHIDLPSDVEMYQFAPFEPEVHEDFNVGEDNTPKIPRIIHQTWKDTMIPPKFVDGIKSYAKHSGNWEYFLWTDISARDFIADYYPHLLPVWDGYMYKKDKMRRADAIRYVALYHFGGLYADMDTINYRSLDDAITKHACVFTPEPFEHAVSRGLTPYLINNAVMMCAPRHPFLKFLIDNLAAWSDMQVLGDATGPGFLTTQYKLYHSLNREPDFTMQQYKETNKLQTGNNTTPFFQKGDIPLTDERFVYIANTQYFMHTLDKNSFQPLIDLCRRFHQLTHLQKRACVNAKRQGLVRRIHQYAFIDHKWHMTYAWYNFYSYMPLFNSLFSTDIKELVPHYKVYEKA